MIVESERLILREWTSSDFDAYAAMMADPRVMEFLSLTGTPMKRFDAWRSLAGTVGHWGLRGFGLFAVVERQTGTFVGQVGPWQPEGWPGLEVGWTLRSEFWGRGYATEAARRSISYAFDELGVARVISLITPENARSIAVAQRLGERLDGEVSLPHLPADRRVLQYAIERSAWRR
ncbi:MAG: GNAT family N-acetyltransferase [Acidobacteria bacterium]|nr:GNAT family N-acetyltransferase [Acidobacteriota bacterium]